IMGAYTIGAMGSRLIAGWLVDTYGRKRLLSAGLLLIVAATAFYRLANNVPQLFVVRAAHGFCFGLATTALGTMVADILPRTRLTEGLGYYGLTTSISMSMAPMLGYWLAEKYGYPTLFLTVSMISGVTFLLSLTVRGNTTIIPAKPASGPVHWDDLVEKSALPAGAVGFFVATVHGSVVSFISLFAAERGFTRVGLFFAVMSVCMLISRPISGRWADRGGSDQVLLLGLGFMFLGVGTVSLAPPEVGFFLGAAAFGLGLGFCLPTLQALAVVNAPAHMRGAATGTYFLSFDLGIGLGVILSGYLAKATSYQTMYLATLAPLVISGVLHLKLRASRQQVITRHQ
ncbi:MAG TPA: MFS transporter, partial [Bacillota bacterium]|nr:MFS transporter [Bacillota bacterium]